jgi:large subunit ribosomal protein L25
VPTAALLRRFCFERPQGIPEENPMSEVKSIKASARVSGGKGAARAIRRNAQTPAVIYGGGEAPRPIALDANQTRLLIFAGHFLTTTFDIEVDGAVERVIPRDYQLDPVKDTPLHVDFLRISAGSTVRVFVPVHFLNQENAPALKQGGALNIVRHEVELVVPADDIPESINVDISGLAFGDAVRISAGNLPAQHRPVITDRDFVLATMVGPGGAKAEDEPAAAA